MLREEVVSEVRQGKFHIYAVENVDQGIEVLTGVPAGKRRKDGSYPAGSINHLVQKQLLEMAARMRQFAAPAEEKKKKQQRDKAAGTTSLAPGAGPGQKPPVRPWGAS